MDARHFDHLARMLSRVSARRSVVRLLTALPVLAALAALLDPGESDAAGRRKRRKKRHKHAQNKRKGSRQRKRKCKAKSRAKTCAGKCGIVKNNCKKRVDCGSCACAPPCPVCQLCDETTRSCVPDPGQQGNPCGAPGQVCQDGSCACTPITTCPPPLDCGEIDDGCGGAIDCGSCANPTPICVSNVCTACSAANLCPSGQYCDAGSCVVCDVCASGCDFTSVQAAIDAASGGDTLVLCPGTYSGATGRVVIGKNLTLIGAGGGNTPTSDTILDAAGSGRVMEVDAAVTVSLQRLRITGGNTLLGSGISNVDGTVTLTDCTVTANSASFPGSPGGGIFQDSAGALTLDNTIVHLNAASSRGGGIFVQSGVVNVTNGSAITENTAIFGGGIFVNPGGAINLDSSSSVTENEATNGGGIFLVAGGTVTLNGATVEDNEPNDCVGLVC